MKLDFSALSRSQIGVLAAFGLVIVVLTAAFLIIVPMRKRTAALREDYNQSLARNNQALENVRKVKHLEALFETLSSQLATETNLYLLRPVLGSYPVQRNIYRLAADTHLQVESVRELSLVTTPYEPPKDATPAPATRRRGAKPLPVTTAQPSLFARYTVELVGKGSLVAIAQLLERLENENPYCGVTALTISAASATPETHRLSATLEWPVAAPSTGVSTP